MHIQIWINILPNQQFKKNQTSCSGVPNLQKARKAAKSTKSLFIIEEEVKGWKSPTL